MALLGFVIVTAAGMAAAQNAGAPVGIVGQTPRSVSEGVLDLLAYSVVPDGTLSTVQLDRGGGDDNDIGVSLSQLGAGFTWSDSFPLYLEGFLGYARYDPRFVFSDGQDQRRISTRWDQFSVTIGVGYDFPIAKNLYLRPILNAAIAQVTTDAALATSLLAFRNNNQDLAAIDRGKLNAYGLGGSLMLAYYDHLPAREIDIELRTTDLQLQTFGDTTDAVKGDTNALTVNLWGRLRWPTGTRSVSKAGQVAGGGPAFPLSRRPAGGPRVRASDQDRRRTRARCRRTQDRRLWPLHGARAAGRALCLRAECHGLFRRARDHLLGGAIAVHLIQPRSR